jgi:anhydro-N-acetylmuramic acid kinase
VTGFLPNLAGKRRLRVAGLMSGTSADGVDVAIVDIRRPAGRGLPAGRELGGVQLLAFQTLPYPADLRRQIFSLFDPQTARVDDLCHLNFVLGEVFAKALVRVARRSGIALDSIDLVGSHGQTIYHIPEGRPFGGRRVASTLQIGEPSIIAERTGITTVADFRPRDVAAGGQGAPLVPFADYILFRHGKKSRAVQNIGGIANVAFLPAGRTARMGGVPADILAFDTGPGNMIIDRLAVRATEGKARYDVGGRMAARGVIDQGLLAELMRHPYLRRRPPKSTGREMFGVAFSDDLWQRARQRRIDPNDLLATATAFTARSIAQAYRKLLPSMPDEVIVCGGGARNRTLVGLLAEDLRPARVAPMDEFGLSAQAKEAVSFALLAWATVCGVPNNVPSATGACRAAVLGKVIPGRDQRPL